MKKIAWTVVILGELALLMNVAIAYFKGVPLTRGDIAFILSAVCVFLSGFISLRTEWKNQKKKS